jgi:hypothetical protein
MITLISNSYSQEEVASDSSDFSVDIDLGVSSRNVWRGLDYGESPSIWGDLYGSFKNFSVGAMGTTTLNGSKAQYGTWLELYASYEFKNLTFVVDDYFFFNAADSANNYFDYSQENTQHLVEARVEHENDFLKAMVGYVVYSNAADNTNGVYMEATYKASKKLSFNVGYLTASQWLSFYDAGGITTLGINGHRELNVLKQKLALTASLIFNPNYENANPWVGNNPVYFVLKTEF